MRTKMKCKEFSKRKFLHKKGNDSLLCKKTESFLHSKGTGGRFLFENLAKVLALVVLAMFVLSIPAVMAEAQAGEEAAPAASSMGAGVGKLADPETKEEAKEAKAEVKAEKNKNAATKEIKPKEVKTFVEKTKEKILEVQTFQQLRERRVEIKKAYDEQKEKVRETREEIKSCKGDALDSEKCQDKKSELKLGVKNHLIRTIELIQNSFERLNNRIEDSKVLTEKEKASALAMIKENQDKLSAEMEKLKAMSENATNEELKTAIKEVRELWQETNKAEKYLLAQLINNKLENLVEKHNEYYNAMIARIKFLADAGQNTDALNKIAEDFKAASDKLKEDEKLAEEKWLVAKEEKTKETLEAARQAQKTVREDLRKTKQLLRDFLAKFKEQYMEMNPKTAKTSAEAQENTETETGTAGGNAEESAIS